jgi:hypothetical protein
MIPGFYLPYNGIILLKIHYVYLAYGTNFITAVACVPIIAQRHEKDMLETVFPGGFVMQSF